MKRLSLIIAVLLLALHAQTQPRFDFKMISVDDGLSNGFVTSIAQDSLGFIWLGTAYGLNRYDGYDFKTWYSDEGDPNSLSDWVIWDILIDTDSTLWLATLNGLTHFNPKTETFQQYFHDPDNLNSITHNYIDALEMDKDGNIWIGTERGLTVYNKETQRFQRKVQPNGGVARGIAADYLGRMWYGVQNYIVCEDLDTGDTSRYKLPDSPFAHLGIRELYFSDNQTLWIGTMENGAYCFNLNSLSITKHFAPYRNPPNQLSGKTVASFGALDDQLLIGMYHGGLNFLSNDQKEVFPFETDLCNPAHIKFDVVRAILKDRDQNIWMGTEYGGLKVLLHNKKPFINYAPNPNKECGLNFNRFDSFLEREDGNILITSGPDIYLFDPRREVFNLLHSSFKKDIAINSIIELTPRKLLIATIKDGLILLDEKTNVWQPINFPNNPFKNSWITSSYKDQFEHIWIGSQKGLYKYDPKNNKLEQIELAQDLENVGSNLYVLRIQELSDGRFIFHTKGGINLYAPNEDRFDYFPSSSISGLYETRDGKIWVGTHGSGLGIFNPDKGANAISIYEKASEILNQSVGIIGEDKNGHLWCFYKDGLLRLNPITGQIRQFNYKDGLLNNSFLGVVVITRSGEFFLTGSKGIDRFDPAQIRDNEVIPNVVISKFEIFNKEVPIRTPKQDSTGEGPFLDQNIAYTEHLTFPYQYNDFSFHFAAIDYTAPENNGYQYKLEGYQEEWIETKPDKRFAYYTSLNWGEYTFRIKGSNNDGDWGEETALRITILPPWWATWWAIGLYIIVLGSLAYFIFLFLLRQKLEHAENERLKELDQVKTKLYTNITHEFRTPLTVILGMSDHLKAYIAEAGKDGLRTIKRNGQQLLNLVNQMLDLSQLEAGAMQLKLIQGDIVNFLKYLVDSFHSYAEQQNIRIHFLSQEDSFTMDYDPTRLQQVISNLISNAIKYTPNGGDIYIQVNNQIKEDHLQIEIKDTGVGISEDQIPYIFNRFYQVDNSHTRKGEGTGIGLALTKELVGLMQGHIAVRSKVGTGTTFLLKLPISNNAELVKVPAIKHESEELIPSNYIGVEPSKNGNSLPHLLLVEDNQDVMKYLVACLQNRYQLDLAYDGKQGVEKAIENVPDLIISDVMMPLKDGYEVCDILKRDERTSHIPIVLLTAKADIHSRLSGLAKGADAYLPKPFDKNELLIRIQQLLDAQKRLQTHYQTKGHQNRHSNNGLQKLENQKELAFLEKIEGLMELHIHDYQFSVEKLAQLAGLSQAQLNRKLKAVVGMPPGKLIKAYRINRAKELLLNLDLGIAEIANKTGYQDPEYFSTVFKREESMTPSEYRNEQVGNTEN